MIQTNNINRGIIEEKFKKLMSTNNPHFGNMWNSTTNIIKSSIDIIQGTMDIGTDTTMDIGTDTTMDIGTKFKEKLEELLNINLQDRISVLETGVLETGVLETGVLEGDYNIESDDDNKGLGSGSLDLYSIYIHYLYTLSIYTIYIHYLYTQYTDKNLKGLISVLETGVLEGVLEGDNYINIESDDDNKGDDDKDNEDDNKDKKKNNEKKKKAEENKKKKKKKKEKYFMYIINESHNKHIKIGTTGQKSTNSCRYKNNNEYYQLLTLKIPKLVQQKMTGENIESWLK